MSDVAKYPRIPHLPESPGGTKDDDRLTSVDHLVGRRLLFTEKMDGANCCLTREGIFARSHNGPPTHPSFDRAKAVWAAIRYSIPPRVAVFGEWCYAKHSIAYTRLPGFLLVFGVYAEEGDVWWAWAETIGLALRLGLQVVPTLGITDLVGAHHLPMLVSSLRQPIYGAETEGLVVRVADEFPNADFSRRIAKWVRAGHVQTDEHWARQPIVPNQLAKE